ncbi:hypothetical protein J2853_008736 [Streptosporangium lutulentum]|uniref:WD40-like Beta Propeller Repeat n=1 Tax=Streptosporangium lutulentum TaxID=1461250 RepID=A0ABT9QRZ7_9ACTN|nr:hypothetical protein [Streptosporangium lutulentum]MDP9849525.1 hypothetical protein [Streptosporangium lutulentum]
MEANDTPPNDPLSPIRSLRSRRSSPRRSLVRYIGAATALLVALLAVNAYATRGSEPERASAWKPERLDPPVQYAFLSDESGCENPPRQEELDSSIVTCSDWTMRVEYKKGKDRQELGLLEYESCDDSGINANCSNNITITAAASRTRTGEGEQRGVPFQVSLDGHRVAYFDKGRMAFVGWDLPSAKILEISPALDVKGLHDLNGVAVSPRGRFFSVAFTGDRPRVLLTDFSTGRTLELPGFCGVLGLSEDTEAIALRSACPDPIGDEPDRDKIVTIVNHRGQTLATWPGGEGDLSPDGKTLANVPDTYGEENVDEQLVTYDARTGRVLGKRLLKPLSEDSHIIGYGWLDDDEYIVKAETTDTFESFGYYAVNIRTGKTHRIRDLGLNPGERVSLGKTLRSE